MAGDPCAHDRLFRLHRRSLPGRHPGRGRGQIEAAKALGLSGTQRFRLVVFPQALRTILPPLGNDFVAMVKDSSLVSVLGVADITQMGKVYASGSFRFFETYSIVAYIYLILTIGLSLVLRRLESACGSAAAIGADGPSSAQIIETFRNLGRILHSVAVNGKRR